MANSCDWSVHAALRQISRKSETSDLNMDRSGCSQKGSGLVWDIFLKTSRWWCWTLTCSMSYHGDIPQWTTFSAQSPGLTWSYLDRAKSWLAVQGSHRRPYSQASSNTRGACSDPASASLLFSSSSAAKLFLPNIKDKLRLFVKAELKPESLVKTVRTVKFSVVLCSLCVCCEA